MTIKEYFGDWWKVLDHNVALNTIKWLNTLNKDTLCPKINNVFKAFEVCKYNDCKAVFIGQDPYPQRDVATGLLFANNNSITSPSLKVIRDSVCSLYNPYKIVTFDATMDYWTNQGILLLNSALTTEVGKVGVHINKWLEFIGKFIQNMSLYSPGIIYVLFGNQAKMLRGFIGKNNYVFTIEHPAYFARHNIDMPNKLWHDINNVVYKLYGNKIKWCKEINI
mgnify:CR=1 FL=1